jgi:acetoin utilization protein AcuB
VRHLPVLERGELVGILSQRELFLTESLRDVDAVKVPVEDAMSTDVYAVPPEKPLGEVAAKMVERKYGSAVIVRDGHVLGIFTTTDALRVVEECRQLLGGYPSPAIRDGDLDFSASFSIWRAATSAGGSRSCESAWYLPRLAIHPDATAMRRDDPLRDVETEPRGGSLVA